MSFFSSLFGGSNPTLSSTMGKTGQISDFASSQGQQNTTAGSSFFNGLLSGDATKTSQALAPQISAAKTSLQSDQKKASETGSRSGGTAGANNAAQDKVHSDITNMTGTLTGGAASTLLSSGSGLLGTALGGYNQQANMSQVQMDNWQNSLFGGALTGGAAIGMKALGSLAGGS